MVIIAEWNGAKRAFVVDATFVEQEKARLEKEGYIIIAVRYL
jgi:hypothetical protein